MDERTNGGDALVDIVTRYSNPKRTRKKRIKSEDLEDVAHRFRLFLFHDDRSKNIATVDQSFVIDCRNRAATDYLMGEIRRLMERLDGFVLPE